MLPIEDEGHERAQGPSRAHVLPVVPVVLRAQESGLDVGDEDARRLGRLCHKTGMNAVVASEDAPCQPMWRKILPWFRVLWRTP